MRFITLICSSDISGSEIKGEIKVQVFTRFLSSMILIFPKGKGFGSKECFQRMLTSRLTKFFLVVDS